MNSNKTGEFIRILRKEKDLTQLELSKKLKVSNQSVSKWETGACLPDPSKLEKISKIFNVSITELLSGERKTSDSEKDKNIIYDWFLSYYEEQKKKYKSYIITIIVLSLIIIIPLLICLINNSSDCKVYSIYSDNSEDYVASGEIILTDEFESLNLSELNIIDENENDEYYTYEYALYINNDLIIKVGDIEAYEHSDYDETSDLLTDLNNINIYLNNDLPSINNIENQPLTLIVNYLDKNLKIQQKEFTFHLVLQYSNS